MEKDRLDVCSSLIADTVVGFFCGDQAETTVHKAFGALTVIRDICIHYFGKEGLQKLRLSSEVLAERENPLLKRFKKNEQNPEVYDPSIIGLANFTKHAGDNTLARRKITGFEGMTALVLTVRDYEVMIDALKSRGLIEYEDNYFFNLNGVRKPRVDHLIDLFTDFTEESRLAPKPSNILDYVAFYDGYRDRYFDKICDLGLRKNKRRNEGVFLLESWIEPTPAAAYQKLAL